MAYQRKNPAQAHCVFVAWKSIGRLDERGGPRSEVSYAGRNVARRGHELEDLVIPFVEELLPYLHTTVTDGRADLQALKDYVNGLAVTPTRPTLSAPPTGAPCQ